eukprot:1159916-Pelagomonas_calceolata.AAC.2
MQNKNLPNCPVCTQTLGTHGLPATLPCGKCVILVFWGHGMHQEGDWGGSTALEGYQDDTGRGTTGQFSIAHCCSLNKCDFRIRVPPAHAVSCHLLSLYPCAQRRWLFSVQQDVSILTAGLLSDESPTC